MRLVFCFLFFFVFGFTSARADFLSEYVFNGGALVSIDADAYSDASNFSQNLGTVTYNNEYARVDTSQTPAADNLEYFAFSIAPQAGYQVNLSSLSFDASFYNAVTSNTYVFNIAVRSSVDGFTNAISTTTITPEALPATPSFTTYTIDLSALTAYQNLTTSTGFRIYVWDSLSGGTRYFALDNVILSGSTSALAIPEPSVYALMLLGISTLAFPLRRKFSL